jgi:hypothetical protein
MPEPIEPEDDYADEYEPDAYEDGFELDDYERAIVEFER